MLAESWTGQAGCTHQGGVGLDGDQLCPSGAAVLFALLPALSGRGEVVALPRIPEPANRAKLASPCTPETQQLGWGNCHQPKGQESDSGQSGHQPTQCVRMSAPLCTCPYLGAQLQRSSCRALGRGASYRNVLALGRAGSCTFGMVIQTQFPKCWELSQGFSCTRSSCHLAQECWWHP